MMNSVIALRLNAMEDPRWRNTVRARAAATSLMCLVSEHARAASLRQASGSGRVGAMTIPVPVASAPRSENLAPTDFIVEWQLDSER